MNRKLLLPLIFSLVCFVPACTSVKNRIKSDISAVRSGVYIDRADTMYEESNYAGALEQYRIAAEHGSPRAQYILGRMYVQGKGTAPDRKKAVKWIQKAALNEYNAANFDMGLRYLSGDGVSGNYEKSLMHFKRAAKKEHDLSMYFLGTAYALGLGLQPDAGEALRWFRMAHAYGYPVHSTLLSKSGVIEYMEDPATLENLQAKRLLNPSNHLDARIIQRKLARLGHYTMKIDGLWGKGSRAALKKFQRAKGLKADGVWTMETQRKLLSRAGN